MPILRKLRECLEEAKISYEVASHPLAYTAQEIAQSQHVSGNQIAKVVMLKADDALVMCVITGNQKIHLPTVRASLGVDRVRLAIEDEFTSRFPGCEIGAMPPFGNLFGVPTYVDPRVALDEAIYFNAGNHAQTVRLSFKDYARLADPKIVPLAEAKKKQAA